MARPKLGRVWSSANTATRRDPGDTKYVTGWLAEIPTFQVLNYLQWKNDTTIQALAERGIMEWGSDVAYLKGAAVWDETNGAVYVSTVSGPSTSLKPSSNSNQWTPSAIQISRKSYDDIVSNITTHIADVTSNPHKLTPVMVGTYSTAQIDALVAQYRAEVNSHASDTNNPHKLTAAIIGAVPVTGGTYSGNVTMGTGQIILSDDGKSVVKADSSSVYFGNAAGSMGVDASGKGFIKTGSGTASEIITASTFADNKKLVEPNYAYPQPIWLMPFIRDINIYTGAGISNDLDTPQFDSSGHYVINQTAGKGHGLSITDNPSTGLSYSTLSLDVQFGSIVSDDTTDIYSVGFGTASGGNRLYIRPNGTVVGRDGTGTVGVANCSDLKTHRVVFRVTPTGSSLFLDGVLVSQYSGKPPTIVANSNIIFRSESATSGQLVPVSISYMRFWNLALTDSQISNI